jgi:SAM-dependent methyltransferase
MTTDYNKYVDDYEKTENSLFRTYIEKPSVLSRLKDIQSKSVLDLACGLGRYAQIMKREGAAYVMGVDISEKMIARARLIEQERPLGIEYMVRDVSKLEPIGLFDLVTAIYLFPYAKMEQDLLDMAQAIANNLKPEGRLVALTLYPDGITEKHCTAAEKYDIYLDVEDYPLRDGAPLKVTLNYPGQKNNIPLLTYYWSRETYEKVLKKVGFRKIEWHPLFVAAEGIKEYGESYWQDYLANPHLIVLECHK